MSNLGLTLNRFLIGRFASALGDQLIMFAVPLLVFKKTNNLAMSGLAFAIEWIPRLISLPMSGELTDRLGGRKLYLISDLSRGIACLLVFLTLEVLPSQAFWILAIFGGIVGFFHEQAFIALEATVPLLVKQSELARAQTILQGLDSTGTILGPALAAFAIIYVDTSALLIGSAITFLLSLLNILTMSPTATGKPIGTTRPLTFFASFVDSLATIGGSRPLRYLIGLTMIVNLMSGLSLALTPGAVQQLFGRSESEYGILMTTSGLVGVAVFVGIPKLIGRFSLIQLGSAAFVMMCLGLLIHGIATNIWLYAVGYLCLMSAVCLYNVFMRTHRAQLIPHDRLGRTLGAIILLNMGTLPLAGMMATSLVNTTGVQPLLGGLGVGALPVGLCLLRQIARACLQTQDGLVHSPVLNP